MKKIACIILIAGLIIGTHFSQARAAEFGPVLPFFEKAGPAVGETAAIGGMICGIITGVVGGIPLGYAGMIIGLPFNKILEFGTIGMMIPALAGNLLGQVALGTPVLITKFLLYDAPKTLFNPETYKLTDK